MENDWNTNKSIYLGVILDRCLTHKEHNIQDKGKSWSKEQPSGEACQHNMGNTCPKLSVSQFLLNASPLPSRPTQPPSGVGHPMLQRFTQPEFRMQLVKLSLAVWDQWELMIFTYSVVLPRHTLNMLKERYQHRWKSKQAALFIYSTINLNLDSFIHSTAYLDGSAHSQRITLWSRPKAPVSVTSDVSLNYVG